MLENIDVSRMNRLMKENRDARKIIAQLLENHRTEVSMIAHEIRNPLTLVSSSLQIMEAQHPEVKEFHNWSQTVEDVRFMCDLLNDLSSFNNSRTLHYSVFPVGKLLKNIASPSPCPWTPAAPVRNSRPGSVRTWASSLAIR